ncbi:hypothetical protein [Nostoc sp.]|uniref:hypothetical protein n=1 Tax=Nostoc sp. TaxID=1180 RepID=UPI002FF6A555
MIKDIQSVLFSTYMMWVVFDFTRAIATGSWRNAITSYQQSKIPTLEAGTTG